MAILCYSTLDPSLSSSSSGSRSKLQHNWRSQGVQECIGLLYVIALQMVIYFTYFGYVTYFGPYYSTHITL